MKQSLINKLNFTLYFILRQLFDAKFKQFRKIKIASSEETLQQIIDNRLSIARFGDGELTLLAGNNTGFQDKNEQIISKLRHILKSDNSRVLIGLPYVWKNLWPLKYRAFEFWGGYLNRSITQHILPFVSIEKQYYDTNFTRFYIDYRTDSNAKKLVPIIKKIWHNRNVCFIEGEFSRLGVGNDLFNNATDIKRILCPSRNAFQVYDEIMSEAKQLPKDTLILIALGMTATCLAYDLSMYGYQAIDIGHIDVEYEWFKMKAKDKVALDTKFVAESSFNNPVKNLHDAKYQSEIIAKIGI